jgi:lipopolysaccharide transport system permease protein
MPVGYENCQFDVDESARTIAVSFTLINQSGDVWTRAAGFAIGYQIYDPETGTFIAEGEWTSLEKDLAPAETTIVSLSVQLPPEKGRYHVYVSPRTQHRGWFYAKGDRFLLLDASVEHGRAALLESRATTLKTLRRRKLRRSVRRLFTAPALAVWCNWSLIRSLVRRDISARYRGSFGDMFWTILNPLLLMATYFFVFGVILQSRFPGDDSPGGFVLYFLAGMLPWLPFSEALGRAPNIILEHRNFVKKLVFPVEVLPIDVVLAGLVTGGFALCLFLIFLMIQRETVPPTALWLPALIIPQVLFTMGAVWFLSAVGVFFRDLPQVMGFLLTLWFFITPICYPESSMPPGAWKLLGKNPIYVLVRGYRSVLLENHAPEMHSLWKLWLLSIFILLAGYAAFYKLRRSFADVI